tara:strand:+ start:60 stop:206 length:147 start_codon:yes stop_codon:yes gene_type:complete
MEIRIKNCAFSLQAISRFSLICPWTVVPVNFGLVKEFEPKIFPFADEK